MGTDPRLLRDQCSRTLTQTNFTALGQREEGKVRDSYVQRDRRTIVVTDRVSCFDVVVGTLPFKGQVLNQLAAFWFDRTRAIAPNHLISVPDPCVSIVHELRPLLVEFVMRGYLTGSTKHLDLDRLRARRAQLLRPHAARGTARARVAARAAAHAHHEGAQG